MSNIRERNRQLILDAASEEFARKGFAGATIGEIAQRVGLTKPKVFYYFLSKEDLYWQVLQSVIEPSLAASALLCDSREPTESLAAFIREKIRVSRDMPCASKVFACEMLLGASRIPAHLRDALEAETQRHLALLQDWMHRGLIAPVEVSHLLLAISAATRTHECFDLQMAGITGKDRPDDADYESAIATAVRLVVGGAAANMSGGAKGIATADQ